MADVSSGRRYGVDPRTLLVTFLDTLPSREAEIARLRYGIGSPSLTEEQLASMFKVSKENIVDSLANVQRWLTRVAARKASTEGSVATLLLGEFGGNISALNAVATVKHIVIVIRRFAGASCSLNQRAKTTAGIINPILPHIR